MGDNLVKNLQVGNTNHVDARLWMYDAATRIEELQARVAELEAERDAIAQQFDKEDGRPALMARIIMQSISNEVRAEAAEALLPEAVKAGMMEGATVKPLVWEDVRWGNTYTTCGLYKAKIDDGGGAYSLTWGGKVIRDSGGRTVWFATLESAKAAAQADYDARILSALDDPDPETIARIVAKLKEDRG